jgi:hypothetical protein
MSAFSQLFIFHFNAAPFLNLIYNADASDKSDRASSKRRSWGKHKELINKRK